MAIVSYEVGALFKIVDEATPALLKIAEKLAVVNKEMKGLDKQFAAFGRMNAAGLLKSLEAVQKAIGGVADRSIIAKDAIVANFAKADGGIDRTIAAVERLNIALGGTKSASAGLGRIGAGAGRRGMATAGADAEDIYRGIPRIGLGGPYAQALGPWGPYRPMPPAPPPPGGAGGGRGRRGMGGGHGGGGHAGIGLGIMGVMGAEEVGHGLFDVIKDASELRHIQEQMLQGGMKELEIAQATAAAKRVGYQYGLDVAKVLGDVKELRFPFGSTQHAIEFLEPLEKMRIVLNAVSEGKGNESRDAVYKMARSGELKGLNNADEYLRYFDSMTKVISATGGKVGPNDYMQATKYSRLSALGFNEDYYTKYLPTMIQSLGASGAGTANAALFGTLIQGKVTSRSAKAMDSIGLIGDRTKLRYDVHGNMNGFNSGAIVDTELLTQNPLEWVRKDLLPRMEKKFGDLSNDKNKSAAIDNLGDFFGNRMSAQAVGEMLFRMKSFDRDSGLIGQARGIGGADHLQEADPMAVAEKLSGAWGNLMKAAGASGVDTAVKGMNSLASGLTDLTKWADEHPLVVKSLLGAMAGLAAGLAVFGSAAVIVSLGLLAPGAAVAVAIGSTISLLAGIAAVNWDSITAGLDRFAKAIRSIIPQLPAAPGGGDGGGLGLPGLDHSSYHGGALFQRMSFGGTGANDNFGFGPSNASSVGSFSNSSIEGVRQYIRARATSLGIDPNIAERVARSEGLNSTLGAGGDGGSSDGPYQLHVGGGLGDIYQRIYGHSIHDKRYVKDQIDFALQMASRDGWGAWHGAARVGIGPHEGIGVRPPPMARQQETHTHHIHMDSKIIATAVTKRQTQMATMPNAIGAHDSYGSYFPPGGTMVGT